MSHATVPPSATRVRNMLAWSAALTLLCAIPLSAQLPGFLKGNGKKSDYLTLKPVASNFEVEYPRSNWQVVPGYAAAQAMLVQAKGDASVAIEHSTLRVAYTKDDVKPGSDFEKLSLDNLHVGNPTAKQFEPPQYRDSADGPVVVIEFVRDGARGQERVRHYSMPRGLDMYRVVCTALATVFPRYDTTFEYMAASLKSSKPAGAP